jgi:hypothetical protein
MTDHPFVPTSNTQLSPGSFWSIPLSGLDTAVLVAR